MTTALSFAAALLAMASPSLASIADVPAYVVPAVDYSQLYTNAHALLDAMQHDGIVALKNIPNYATLRDEYLRKAAECAVHAQSHGAEFLLHRRLQDGTQRYTISTESGRRLDASGFETVESCPGYQEIYHKFSRTVEDAVAKVGRALDASQALQVSRRRLHKKSTTMTARELMAESVHLDHFHAYEASRSLTEKTLEELSLEMHTDNGLMIAMSAPEYYDVQQSGEVVSHHTRSEDAGLLIKTAEGKTVRPLLQADELILMLGEGINTWIHTTPRLQAVTHGMQYPRGLSYTDKGASHKSLRAWFGKMILLSDDHVMANTGLSFGEFANKTTRYLKDAANEQGFAAVACSPHRRLQASDNKCTARTNCRLKAGGNAAAVPETCAITCNHNAVADVANCEANCECDDATLDGSRCWMLCVPMLSTSECTGDQKCNSAYKKEEIAMTCASGAVTPSTTTTTTTTTPVSTPASTPAPTPTPTTTPPTTKPVQTTAPPSLTFSSAGSSASASGTTRPALVDELTGGSTAAGSGSGAASSTVKTPKPTTKPTPTPSKSAASSVACAFATVAVAALSAIMS